MTAYVVSLVDVKDPSAFGAYGQAAFPTFRKYGAKPLAFFDPHELLNAGDAAELLEGSWPRRFTTVLAFESMERAKEWYHSEEYQAAKKLREGAADVSLVLTEQFDPAIAGQPA